VTYRGLLLNELLFTGADVHAAGLVLKPGPNVLYGASNAGKSFAVKAIDFLLGSSRPLPEIAERKAFDKAWLAIQTPVSGNVPLMRALAGGALELHGGHVDLSSERKTNGRHLSARHDHTNGENVSQFLLKEHRRVRTISDCYGRA
jgi:DNA repair ATPase RecN